MELRDIEIFLTLADELHFGRTAERLHVSAPRVSQAIAKQERRIGAPLFERTSRRVTLTPLGEQLRADLEAGYRRILEGVESAASTARSARETLTFGVMGPLWQELAPVTALFRARNPHVDLRMREVRIDEPFRLLREGEVDVALLWLPVEEKDLAVGPVTFTEPIVLAVGRTHPLATRSSVSVAELADENVLPSGLPVPDYWEGAVSPVPRSEPDRGGTTPTREEVLWRVMSGDGVAVACAQGIRYLERSDVAYVPLDERPVLRWGLVRRAGPIPPLVAEFSQVAAELGPLALTLDLEAAGSSGRV
ncbi:LysR family transcriptional regulator [Cellulosimicrobium cellulans]|uniref:LysR family transcriptional regulator n=1 Tax=Cellulosimicrobium cellulans TaxID=1710 RepID=A0A4Y4DUA3_CELCE|nr:LysR family transcriptional regulator [Cellulosimicrobium cellulans]GED08217.1 LysR family transcriptional regulator [Cellulosimicrobium cellulans]